MYFEVLQWYTGWILSFLWYFISLAAFDYEYGKWFFLKEGRFTHECLNACLSVCRPIRVLLEYVVLEMFSMWRWFGRRALKSPPLLSVCSSPYVCHRLRNNTAVGIRCEIKPLSIVVFKKFCHNIWIYSNCLKKENSRKFLRWKFSICPKSCLQT